MNLQQAFIKVKSIKQENFLLDGTYNEPRYWGWKALQEETGRSVPEQEEPTHTCSCILTS